MIRFILLHKPYQETSPLVNPRVTAGNSEETAQGQESNEDAKHKKAPGS